MSLIEPMSIAVIGASATPGKVGHDILKNLIEEGYEGEIYPVNPKGGEILGKKAYASVKDIGANVDLAIIVVPATLVPSVLTECAEKKIGNVVIISAGFGETGTEEGKDLEEQIKSIAKGIPNPNIVGPNCLGIVRPRIKMNASFAAKLPPAGSVALVSQSGATAVAVMDASESLGIGYSFVASIGNKTVMDECDFLKIAMEDKETKVIGLYLENIKHGQVFLRAATEATRKKPIVLLKSGISERGSAAAASHTGALAGSDAGVDALCRQSGIIRAHTSQEFLDLLEALSTQPMLPSANIAVITNAGGPGILATDAAELAGLRLPPLGKKAEKTLRKSLPESANTKNPIDVIGDAGTDRYVAALKAAGDDKHIDGLAVLLTPQVMTPVAEIADAIVAWRKTHTSMPIVTCFMGEEHVKEARLKVQTGGVPSFETPERAVQMLAALRMPKSQAPNPNPLRNDIRAAAAKDIIGTEKGLLSEETIEKLCALYGIPLPMQSLTTSEEEAVKLAEDIGYPVIAKISSPDILHKTDIGGIKANLQSAKDVIEAFGSIIENIKKIPNPTPNPTIRGILIQKFLPAGNEFIVGATKDPSFGHLVMVGLGGIYTELLQDTAFRIVPINEDEAYRLLSELHAWKILLGMRGKTPLDIDHLARLIATVSSLVHECPRITDIDFNPVFVREHEVIVADAKIIIG